MTIQIKAPVTLEVFIVHFFYKMKFFFFLNLNTAASRGKGVSPIDITVSLSHLICMKANAQTPRYAINPLKSNVIGITLYNKRISQAKQHFKDRGKCLSMWSQDLQHLVSGLCRGSYYDTASS